MNLCQDLRAVGVRFLNGGFGAYCLVKADIVHVIPDTLPSELGVYQGGHTNFGVFSTNKESRFASVDLESVLGPQCPAQIACFREEGVTGRNGRD